tara:strand:- start:563 stop:736 length:174 start_codon:yes stop_codon:yes gene_type:complete
MYQLKEKIEDIESCLEDLEANAFECDSIGECVADSQEFQRLLKTMNKFVNSFTNWND